jgi:ribosomal protein S18 acetylase RimI-like enzyme
MPAELRRLHLRCALAVQAGSPVPGVRTMSATDIPALGTLLHAAYQGTVDDEGESEAEAVTLVADTFGGKFGPLLADASLVLEIDGQLVSAAFITIWNDRPLLAFAVTRPDRKGQGFSGACTSAAMQALARAGHRALDLFVTETNAPARALYARLGFTEAGTPSPPT